MVTIADYKSFFEWIDLPVKNNKYFQMKKILFFIALFAITGNQLFAQKSDEDKSKRVSLPAKVTQQIPSGATVIIDYSQPSIKGRTIGKDLEPLEGKVWRTGANEATIFETDKDITVDDQELPAGKYGFFTIFNGKDVTLIFNKTWDQWGAFSYKDSDDQLRVKTKYVETDTPFEKMTFTMSPEGEVNLFWGNRKVTFQLK